VTRTDVNVNGATVLRAKVGGPHGGIGGDQTQMGGLLWQRVEAPLKTIGGIFNGVDDLSSW
jgi:hypothetical protein